MKKFLSLICSCLYLLMSILHLLLIFGAPLGEYVLGGNHIIMPLRLRVVNLVFCILWLFIAYLYLIYSNILATRLHFGIVKFLLTIATDFTSVAIFFNLFITSSAKERFLMTPLSFVVSICSIWLLVKCEK